MGWVNHEPRQYLPQAFLAALDLEYHVYILITNLMEKQ